MWVWHVMNANQLTGTLQENGQICCFKETVQTAIRIFQTIQETTNFVLSKICK